MKIVLAMIAPLLLAVSCAPTTPKARIENNPGRFLRLTDREKDLVQRGQIDRGMSMEGVWLAWGEPSRRYAGSRSGKTTERWVYTSSTPVHTTTFVSGFGWGGFGWGGMGRYGYRGYGVGIAPQIDYIPEDRASVLFINHRVDSWERKH
jgi:hypothetical protein